MHPIINKYLEAGHITKEAATRLELFETTIKEAGFLDSLTSALPSLWKSLKGAGDYAARNLAGPALVTGAAMGLGHVLDNRARNKQMEGQMLRLKSSFEDMHKAHPELQNKDVGQVTQRFNEIAAISPTLANSPAIAGKMVIQTLKKGLDENDVSKLYQLEANVQQSLPGQAVHPMSLAVRMVGSSPLAHQVVQDAITKRLDQKDFSTLVSESKMKLNDGSEDGSTLFRPENVQTRLDAALRVGIKISPEFIKGDYHTRGAIIQADGADVEKLFPEVTKPSHISNDIQEGPTKEESIVGRFKSFFGKNASVEDKKDVLETVEFITKSAGLLSEGLLKGLLTSAVIGAGVGGVHQLGNYIAGLQKDERLVTSWEKVRSDLKTMSAQDSQLTGGVDYNDKTTQNAAHEVFNTLTALAPDIATNPLIARGYVNNIMQREGNFDISDVKVMTDIQKNMDTSGGYKSPFSASPVVRGFESGFQLSGGSEFVRALPKALTEQDKKQKPGNK